MLRDENIDNSSIEALLTKDPIQRNNVLNNFLRLINTIEKNSILTIDGKWGSGKTVFVRQIEYLNDPKLTKEKTFAAIEGTVVNTFQEKYATYYYNAWENDHHGDPMQSLLLNLINDIWGPREKTADKTLQTIGGLKDSVLKVVSQGLYDHEAIKNAKSIHGLAKSITTIEERKKAINDIINNYLDLNNKKLLFIIDELDRCKPTFSVNLLETLKHFFDNDRIVFLLSTNNLQLAHTIEKVYGPNFDGIGYLNKFYNLIFNLSSIDIDRYIDYLRNEFSSRYHRHIAPMEVTKYLNLSIREINRYYATLELASSYILSSSGFNNSLYEQLVKQVFVPLAYGLRISNLSEYYRFVEGKGEDILNSFIESNSIASDIIRRNEITGSVYKPNDKVKEIYKKLFNANGKDFELAESADGFRRIVSLINSTGTIDEEEAKKS